MSKHGVCGDLYVGTKMLIDPLDEISYIYKMLDDDLKHDRELSKMGQKITNSFVEISAKSANVNANLISIKETILKWKHYQQLMENDNFSWRKLVLPWTEAVKRRA